MAIDFPNSPSNGDTFTVLGKTWAWNGESWKVTGSAVRGISLKISDTAPSSPAPVEGDMWYESDTGRTFTYYDSVWVELGNTASVTSFLADADSDTRIHVEETADEDTIRFDTAGVERLTIGPTGDVGVVGDLTVGGDFTVSGTTTTLNTTELLVEDNKITLNSGATGSATADAGIEVERGDDPNVEILWDESAGAWKIATDFTVDTDTLHVDSTNSRVGIGTTTPSYKLHVRGGSSNDTTPEFVIDGNGSMAFHNGLGAGSYNGIVNAGDMGIIFTDGTQGTGEFVIAPWASGTSGMRIDSSGNVGIGTTTPDQALHVVGKGAFTDAIVTGASTTTVEPWSASTIALGNYGSVGTQGSYELSLAWNWDRDPGSTYTSHNVNSYTSAAGIHLGDSGIKFQTEATWSGTAQPPVRMLINPSGDVGIGDTTPSYKLDVNGDINTTGAFRTDGKKTGLVLLTSGDVSSGGPITFTSLFSSEFDNYIVYLSELTCTGQNAIYYRTASSGSWNTSSVYSNQRIYGQSTSVGAQRFSSTYAQIGYAGARESSYEVHFFSPYLSTQTSVMSRGAYSDNTNPGYIEIHHSYVDNTTSYDGFVFDEVTGAASISCRYEVYGIPK